MVDGDLHGAATSIACLQVHCLQHKQMSNLQVGRQSTPLHTPTAQASGPRPWAAGVHTLSCCISMLHCCGSVPHCCWSRRASRAFCMKGCRHISAGDMRARGSGCRAPCTKSRAQVLPAPSRVSRVWKRAHSSCTQRVGVPMLTLPWNLICKAADEPLEPSPLHAFCEGRQAQLRHQEHDLPSDTACEAHNSRRALALALRCSLMCTAAERTR